MSNLLSSELFKLRKDRSFWTLMIALAASAIFYEILVVIDNDSALQSISVAQVFAEALGANSYIIKLIPPIFAGFFISSEYTTGTMKTIIASGNSRLRIYFAKVVAFSVGAAVLSMVFPLLLMATGGVLSGFHDMPELGNVLRSLGMTVIYAVAFGAIMTLVAIISTESGKTIGILLLFFFLFDSILYMLSSKFAWFEPIFEYSIFRQFSYVGEPNLTGGDIGRMMIVPVLTIIGLWLLGAWALYRKEIK